MKIGPLFKWFGSKWQSAKHYPPPVHGSIVEPYAGGAGYACNYPDRDVLLFEADPLLIELWRWLITECTPATVREIPLKIAGVDIRTLGLSRGQTLLLKHWTNTNSQGAPWVPHAWAEKPGQWTENTRSRVADQIGAIKHWKIGGSLPNVATWFIDPPYQHNHQYKIKHFDFAGLGRFVQRIPPENQVIVCEARGKQGQLPDWLPFVDSHRSVTSRRKAEQSHHSNELVYLQGAQT